MNCQPYREWITEAALGSLDSLCRLQLDAHLVACALCRRAFEAEQKLLAAIDQGLAASLVGTPSTGFAARVRMRIGQESATARAWRMPVGRIRVTAALAALAALALAVGLVHRGSQPPKPAASRIAARASVQNPPPMAGLPSARTERAGALVGSSPTQDHASRIATRPGRAPKREPARPEDQPPQFQVLVEPGQWRAIVAAYRAAQSGRVDAESLAEKAPQDPQPISLKPLEITPVAVAELYPERPTEPAAR